MSHERAKTEQKKVWRMRRKHKRFSFCWVRAPLFLLQVGYDDWMRISIKSESLWCFHVASGWMGNNLTSNKASLSFPCDDCVKGLTYFRNGPRLLGTHSLSWHTFSCSPSLSGFHGSAAINHLIFVIIFATYLHADSQGIDWRKDVEEVSPHEHVVLTKPDKTLQRILIFESFTAGWDVKYHRWARFSPQRPWDQGKNLGNQNGSVSSKSKCHNGMLLQTADYIQISMYIMHSIAPKFRDFMLLKVRETKPFSARTAKRRRKDILSITTYFHRHHNCLWGDETRWMKLPGSGETARSILGCCPVEGHHGPLLEPDGTWCAFSPESPRGAEAWADSLMRRWLHCCSFHILTSRFLSPYDLRLWWFSFVLVNCLCYFSLF